VPLIAVELDHQTVADHQVNPADFVDLNLHAHLQPMGAKAEPCQSLETRLAPSIGQCEQTATSWRLEETCELRLCELSVVECGVDRADGEFW